MKALSATTSNAIFQAITAARSDDSDWPTLAQIGTACDDCEADHNAVAAYFGYLPSISDNDTIRRGLPYQRSYWHNVREVYPDDDRVGELRGAEAVHAFSEFLSITGLEPQPLVLVRQPMHAPGTGVHGDGCAPTEA